MRKTVHFTVLITVLLTASFHVHAHYQKSPYVSDEAWKALTPYLLPEDHPAKACLDKIFSRSRATESLEAMQAAGFQLTETQGQRVHATRHPKISGYIIKMYPDNRVTREDWISWKNRIDGAALIRKQIEDLNYGKYFKVANKWVYPLPINPPLPEKPGYHRKNFVLVVEDMGIYKRRVNHNKWRKDTKRKILRRLVAITRPIGARDCARANNIPWCTDGKIAFVDTETMYTWPINYHGLLEHLSKNMRPYWEHYYKDKCYPE